MRPTDELPILFADRVQSLNYDGPTPPSIYADAGTSIDLATGTITSTGLVVDGVTGDLDVRGDITASELVILDQTGTAEAARFFTTSPGSLFALDTGFAFAFPAVEAARTRGVEGGVTGALGVDTVGIGGTVAKFSSQVSSYSELVGATSYQYGTAEVYGYSDIDTGYAESTLFAESMLGSPAGSGLVNQSMVKVISVPEGYTATSVPYSIEVQGTLRVRLGSIDSLRVSPSEIIVTEGNPEIRVGEWTNREYAAVETDNGYVLLGRKGIANDAIHFRNSGTGAVHIGTNESNDLTITNGGAVSTVNTLDVGTALDVGTSVTVGTVVTIPDGTIAAPVIRFASDTNTGIYRPTTDSFGVSCGGTSSLYVQAGNFYARGVWFTPTAAASDVRVINNLGQLGYFSSSLDTKTDIEPLDLDRALALIDGLEPIWYRSTNEVDRPDWSHYGFIAEHVADLDPRLVGFDPEGKPRTVAYDSIVVPLVAYVRALAARVAELESTA